MPNLAFNFKIKQSQDNNLHAPSIEHDDMHQVLEKKSWRANFHQEKGMQLGYFFIFIK